MSVKVIVSVDGEKITQTDLDRIVKAFAHQENKKPKEVTQEQRKFLLDRLVQNNLLFAEGKARNLEVAESEVERELNSYYTRFGSKEKFEELLEKEGVSIKKFTADLHRDLLIHKTIDSEIEAKAEVTDEDAKDYYSKNKDKMVIPEKVGASHILFSNQDSSDEKAKTKADKVLDEIKGGKVFAECAREYSDCPSKEKGGLLGDFTKGQMVPEFEKAVFEMEVGDLSEPVKTQFGYHIIKKNSQTAQQELDFESVKAYIVKELKMVQGKKIIDALTENLREKAKIEYL